MVITFLQHRNSYNLNDIISVDDGIILVPLSNTVHTPNLAPVAVLSTTPIHAVKGPASGQIGSGAETLHGHILYSVLLG